MDKKIRGYPGLIVNFQKVRLIIGISYGIIKKIVFFKKHRGPGLFYGKNPYQKASEILYHKEI